MPWWRVLAIAAMYEARQHARALAGGIGGLALLVFWAVIALTLEGR